jgi:hypothetical protein
MGYRGNHVRISSNENILSWVSMVHDYEEFTFYTQPASEWCFSDQVVFALCVLVDQQSRQIPVRVIRNAVVGDDLHKLGPCILCSQLLDAFSHLGTVGNPTRFALPS